MKTSIVVIGVFMLGASDPSGLARSTRFATTSSSAA
jgi:hypothetical protein